MNARSVTAALALVLSPVLALTGQPTASDAAPVPARATSASVVPVVTAHDGRGHDHAGHGHDEEAPGHVDPLPPGVHLDDPVDLRALYRRAGLVTPYRARVAARTATASGSTVPAGDPSTPGLSEHVTPSCSGTGSDGNRVQVLYVREASQPSRLEGSRALFEQEVANVDDVFAVSSDETGGGRRVRWVHDADCRPVVDEVVIADGVLAQGFSATEDALAAQGYNRADRKYLAFAEGAGMSGGACGTGGYYVDERPTGNYNDGGGSALARVDPMCWSTQGFSVPAHELTHTLGGVFRDAPHASTYGHCTDGADLMCYDDGSGLPMESVCPDSHASLLDCGHDTYFSTRPATGNWLATHWNTASSSFLDVVPALGSSGLPADEASALSLARAEVRDATVLTGRLTDAVTGAALGSRPVRLEVRWPGAAGFVGATDLTSGSDGAVRFRYTGGRPGTFRLVYAGDAGHLAVTSASVDVRARTTATAGTARRARVLTGRLLRIDGTPAADRGVVLRARAAHTTRWVTVARTRTSSTGVMRARVAPRRATYYRWVFAGSATDRGATSPLVEIRPLHR